MKQPALVIIKPDGISKSLVGNVLSKFGRTELDIIGARMAIATKEQAEEHYRHLSEQPFFGEIINYLTGKYHEKNRIMILVYYGENAIKICRDMAGATNPEEAEPNSIRGSYGRITTKGTYENVVHVSSDDEEAEREIKLWFAPDDITIDLYETKTVNEKQTNKKAWK